MSGSDIYKLAETMERKSKKLIRDLKIALKIETPVQSLDSKSKFAADDGQNPVGENGLEEAGETKAQSK